MIIVCSFTVMQGILRIAELAIEAGFPAGALNVLTGCGLVGKGLIEHPGTNKVRSPVRCQPVLPSAAVPWVPA